MRLGEVMTHVARASTPASATAIATRARSTRRIICPVLARRSPSTCVRVLRQVNAAAEGCDRVLAVRDGVLRDICDGVLGQWRQLHLSRRASVEQRLRKARLAVEGRVPEVLAVEIENTTSLPHLPPRRKALAESRT